MKESCTLLLMFFLLASCGSGRRNPATESQLGSTLSVGGQFSDAEKNIAIRTCYAFKSKNTNFRAKYLNAEFKFLITGRTCNRNDINENLTTVLKAPLSSGSMVFDGLSSVDYFKNVQTDQHGFLSSICSNLLQGGDPQRTILQGNNLVEINFYTSDVDNIIVRTANNQNGNFIVSKEERYKFDTSSSSAGDKVGLISLATRDENCLNGAVSTLSQQFLSVDTSPLP